MPIALASLAAALDPTAGVSALAQYGPGGAAAAVFAVLSWYLFKAHQKTLDLERAQNAELRAENRELDKAIHEKYIPATTAMLAETARLTQVTVETTRVLQELSRRDGYR